MAISRIPARNAPVSAWQRIKDLLKKYKIVSRGLAGLSHVLPDYSAPLTGLSGVASSMGYGRRRRVVHKRKRVVRRRKPVGNSKVRRTRRVKRVKHIRRRK